MANVAAVEEYCLPVSLCMTNMNSSGALWMTVGVHSRIRSPSYLVRRHSSRRRGVSWTAGSSGSAASVPWSWTTTTTRHEYLTKTYALGIYSGGVAVF